MGMGMLENVSLCVGMEYWVKRTDLGIAEDKSLGKFDPNRLWVSGKISAIRQGKYDTTHRWTPGAITIIGSEAAWTKDVPSDEVNVDYNELLVSGSRDLKCVIASRIDGRFWAAGSGKTDAAQLAEAATPGQIDFFVSYQLPQSPT